MTTTTEDTVKQIIAKVGLWWPAADEDKLRAAATACRAFATDIDALTLTANTAATAVTVANQSSSVDQFRTLWQNYDGSCQGYLPGLANAARAMASACDQFAAAVIQAKDKIRELAITIGATLVVGTVLAFFTFGIAEGAALATSASLVSAGAAVGLELSSTAMLIVSSALVGAAFGAIEGAALDVAVAQPIRVLGFHDGGFNLSELESSFVYGGAGGLVFGGAGAGVRAWRLGQVAGGGTAANTLRVFSSADPHVADIANSIEAAFPGRIVGVNTQRAMANGLTREVDIDLGDVIVQVKSGNARGLTGQLVRTQGSTGTRTVGYAPDISDAAWANAAQQGIPIFRTPDELLAYLKEFG